jgi:hypothetical protein
VNTRIVSLLVVLIAFVIRFLLIGAIENDHYVYLARAHQVLHGDWPVRNFADPGIPLAYLLSAAAAAVAGPTLLTDAVLSVGLFAIGVGVAFVLARRASGSMIVALIVVGIALVVPPRLYNSSKMLVPLVAILLAWQYVDRPSTARIVALAVWTGVAFLFRHDYGAYVGIAAALLLLLQHWGEWKSLIRTMATYVGVTTAVIAPWLIYVEMQQGLSAYLASAMRFSIAERDRTVSQWPLAFYATAAVPVAALIASLRGTRYLTAAQAVFAAALVLVSDLVLLRDAPGARLPDVVATTAVLVATIAGRLIPQRTRNRNSTRPILLIAAAVIAAAIGLIAARGRVASATPNLANRWQKVVTRLRDAPPEIMPDPRRAALIRFIERCSAPDERVLIGGFGPELPVLAHRAFAGGLPDWIRGYYEHPDDVMQARAQLGRERVAIAVMLDGGDAFASSWPGIAEDLRARGLTRYDLSLSSGSVELWIRPVPPRDAETGLPCERSSS